jgi:opacity protein-like surface antigen
VIRALPRAAALLALGLALMGARPARAVGYLDDWHPYQTYWAVGWSAAVPVMSMRSGYIDNTGWLGGGFDIRVGVAGRLAVGVSGTWNWFDQTYSTLTLEQGDFTFTGPVYRRLSSFTGLATAHYYFTSGAVQPFVGVGVGGIWISTLQQVVNQSQDRSTSGLAVAGEAGLLFTVSERLGLYLSGRYQLNLTSIPGADNPQWVSGQAGIAYYF